MAEEIKDSDRLFSLLIRNESRLIEMEQAMERFAKAAEAAGLVAEIAAGTSNTRYVELDIEKCLRVTMTGGYEAWLNTIEMNKWKEFIESHETCKKFQVLQDQLDDLDVLIDNNESAAGALDTLVINRRDLIIRARVLGAELFAIARQWHRENCSRGSWSRYLHRSRIWICLRAGR